MMDDFTLRPTEEEIAEGDRIAYIRNDKPQHVNRKMSKDPDHEIHFRGALTEVVFANHFGGTYDDSRRAGGDQGAADVMIGTVRCALKEVKHTYSPPWLHLKFDKLEHVQNVDLCVLAQVQPNLDVTFRGWLPRENFLELYRKMDFSFGERLAVDANQLWPMDWIHDFIHDMWSDYVQAPNSQRVVVQRRKAG